MPIPFLAYNLHSNEGEGDGGDGYTVLIDHTTTPQSFWVAQVTGNVTRRRVDISPYVDTFGGNVYPGGTAFCATTGRMWIAVRAPNRTHDTMLTVDLKTDAVVANISVVKPSLVAHFADCKNDAVGGFTQATNAATGVSTVRVGMLTAAGVFNPFDSADLPVGSTMRLAAVAGYMHDPRWAASAYGALLYSAPLVLPGLLFVSTGGAGGGGGPATLSPLGAVAAAVAVEY